MAAYLLGQAIDPHSTARSLAHFEVLVRWIQQIIDDLLVDFLSGASMGQRVRVCTHTQHESMGANETNQERALDRILGAFGVCRDVTKDVSVCVWCTSELRISIGGSRWNAHEGIVDRIHTRMHGG